jgi:pyruvate/2-oxoacid:ferredoxin oxidoreductase alpha subunit
MVGPLADHYMNYRSKMQHSMEIAKSLAAKADEDFEEVFGRRYGAINEYYCDDAELIVVSAGTIASTARVVVKELREQNIKAGALKIRMFRPFPNEMVRDTLSHAKKVAVIDRDLSPGSGGIFAQEVKSCLYTLKNRPEVFGFLAGLGGKDVTPNVILEMIDYALNHDEPMQDYIWIGLLK